MATVTADTKNNQSNNNNNQSTLSTNSRTRHTHTPHLYSMQNQSSNELNRNFFHIFHMNRPTIHDNNRVFNPQNQNENAQNRTDNTQDNGDSQSQQTNHSQTTNTVPERETDTSMDGTGHIDTDTNLDQAIQETYNEFLDDSGNDDSQSDEQNERSQSQNTNNPENTGNSDNTSNDPRYRIEVPKFTHWIQDQWYKNMHMLKYVILSEEILDPQHMFNLVCLLWYGNQDPELKETIEIAIDRNPHKIEMSCAEVIRGTNLQVFARDLEENKYILAYPDSLKPYYTQVIFDMEIKDLLRICANKERCLGELMGGKNQGGFPFSDYKEPEDIDIENINVMNNNTQPEVNASGDHNSDDIDTNMESSNQGNTGNISEHGGQEPSSHANQSGLISGNVFTHNTEMRTGNVSDTPRNTGGDSDANPNVRGTQSSANSFQNNNNNTNNNGTNNTSSDSTDVMFYQFQKKLANTLFDKNMEFKAKYDNNNKTIGHLIKYRNEMKLWLDRCKKIFVNLWDDPNFQLTLCISLTNSLSASARAIFTSNQQSYTTVEDWLKHFSELFKIDEDFQKHSNMLKDWTPNRNTTVENFITRFLEEKAINDYARQWVETIPNMYDLTLDTPHKIYDACTLNINPKIINDVSSYMRDHYKDSDYDWSHTVKNHPTWKIPTTLKEYTEADTRNVYILQSGIDNLAAYIRSKRKMEKLNTKHNNETILEYKLVIKSKQPGHIRNDRATDIGHTVNNMLWQKNYDKRKFAKDKYYQEAFTNPKQPGYNPRQARKLQNGKGQKQHIGNNGNNNENKNVRLITNKFNEEIYWVEPNTKEMQNLLKHNIRFFRDNSGAGCPICLRILKRPRFGHRSKWCAFLRRFRRDVIEKLHKEYLASTNQQRQHQGGRGRWKRPSNKTKRKKDRKRGNHDRRRRPGRSNNKQNRENTNTAGALDAQSDTSQRGGIISSTNESTQANTTNQSSNNNNNNINFTTNSALIARMREENNKRKAKADAQGTASPKATKTKRNRSQSGL